MLALLPLLEFDAAPAAALEAPLAFFLAAGYDDPVLTI